MWERKKEPGVYQAFVCMHQILHSFRVNHNLQVTCPHPVAHGTSETNS